MRISDWSSDVCSSDLPLRPHQLAVAVDDDVTVDAGDVGDFLAIEEAVVLVAKVARLAAEGDLLGEARAQRIGARDDDPVLDAQFQKGVAAGADLRDEILVRNGDLAILVAALLFIRHLIFDLKRAGTRLDHLLGEEIGRLRIPERSERKSPRLNSSH